ncbi:MAG: HD domain-containing protein [Clostridia bacterium]
MTNKEQFIELYTKLIHRDGGEKLLEWLCSSDFFTAPASTKFHNAKEEGLVEHSVNVYFRLKNLVDYEKKLHPQMLANITEENIAITALLHDVCKANFYQTEFRNAKIDGVWEQIPYFTIKDSLPYGHGEKSVYILCGFVKLTRDEAMAINWHMGGFDSRVKGGDFSLSAAFEMHPFAALMHIADIEATYLDETRN